MFREQHKKMNMLLDFKYFMEFIDNLELDIEAIFEKAPESNELPVYALNGEKVSVFFKNEVRPHNVPILLNQSAKHPLLVAAKYITPEAKKSLKANKINYLDSYGNAYIEIPQLKVYTEHGNAKPVIPDTTKVFTQAGAQLIFQLLHRPEAVNETVRHLAHISQISLGSVSKIMNGLFDEGFLVQWSNDKKYQLIRKEELLDRWIPILNEKVLPNYKIGTYSFSGHLEEQWKTQFLRPNVWWSGEPGAALLTDYLFPEKYSLFTTLEIKEIMTVLKLVPDAKGKITLYSPFWGNTSTVSIINPEDITKAKNHVNPLIIYAQLIHSGDPRNIETAQIIYNEHIAPKF
tara:strand:- start:1193 stop:2230 length:1038 start_codon:yes stop_codon:yes gene_type:complete